jgi:hypothetical protein
LLEQLEMPSRNTALLEREIFIRHRADEMSRRLETIPGIGPITASALIATIGDPKHLASARHLAAWIGLTPRPHSSGGKDKLGPISKTGDPHRTAAGAGREHRCRGVAIPELASPSLAQGAARAAAAESRDDRAGQQNGQDCLGPSWSERRPLSPEQNEDRKEASNNREQNLLVCQGDEGVMTKRLRRGLQGQEQRSNNRPYT